MARGNFNPFASASYSLKTYPICLCLDTSGSMTQPSYDESKRRIDLLVEGIQQLYRELQEGQLKFAPEIAIVTYSADAVLAQDFTPVASCPSSTEELMQMLKPHGTGDMAEGAEFALELCKKRKDYYKSLAIEYVQPLLIVMTDGHMTENKKGGETMAALRARLEKTQEEYRALESAKRLVPYAVYCGYAKDSGADMKAFNDLKGFSVQHHPIMLSDSFTFKTLFTIIAQSASATGGSGDLDVSGGDDWS